MDIAVIGMAGRFAQAGDLNGFYHILRNGMECVRPFSFARISNSANKFEDYLEYAFIENIDHFDYSFFGLTLSEAEKMDPNQRLLLQISYEVFENAGLRFQQISGSKTAVYIADKQNQYHRFCPEIDSLALMGNLKSAAAGRISRFFDLRGNSMMVDSACSSSLVAIHLACQELILGNCQQALVCASEVNVTPLTTDFEGLGVISKSFRSKAFSSDADGIGLGEMVGGVLLKPLSDALVDNNSIIGVIKGISVNQDARLSSTLSAPNSHSQEEVLIDAWQKAGIEPRSIGYIEAHGTGTKLGDPIEIKALNNALAKFTNERSWCAISSVKTNIGHTDSASGMAGLLKVLLSLKYRTKFASLFFDSPNPFIDFENSSVFVNSESQRWVSDRSQKLTAGLSSFSIMGTNAHMVIQEFNAEARAGIDGESRLHDPQIIGLSAHSENALISYAIKLKKFLDENRHLSLGDVSQSLLNLRNSFDFRFSFVSSSIDDAINKLSIVLNEGTIRKKRSRLVIVLDYNPQLDLSLINTFSQHFPFFADVYNSFLKSIAPQHQSHPRISNLLLQLSLIKLFDYQGLKTNDFLADNFGKQLLPLLKGERDLQEVCEKLITMPDSELTVDSSRIHKFCASVGDAIILSLTNGNITKELRSVRDKAEIALIETTAVLDLQRLRQFYSDLYMAGIDLNWQTVFNSAFNRIDVPGYAFEPNRCWAQEPTSIDMRGSLFQIGWVNASEAPLLKGPKTWIILGLDSKAKLLFGNLAQNTSKVFYVNHGTSFQIISDFDLVCDFNSEKSFVDIFAHVDAYQLNGSLGVVFASYLEAGNNATKEILQHQFNLMKACRVFDNAREIQLYVLTCEAFRISHTESAGIRYEQSVAHGFMASASEELPAVKMRSIDVDQESIQSIGQLLIQESLAPQSISVAYRKNQRFTKEVLPLSLSTQKPFELQNRGVYVITGSPRGIGLEVAKWFASLKQITLIFIGRSAIPARKDWQNINKSDPAFSLVFAMKQLELSNADVIYYQADVSDNIRMKAVFDNIKSLYGSIHGLVHAAGIAGDRILANHSWSTFYAALSPKVEGLKNLLLNIETDKLEFFINFSSLDSQVGSIGNTNYSAANAFLDSYVFKFREKGITATTINWPAWRNTGMWYQANHDRGVEASADTLTSNEGLSVLKLILESNSPPQVLVSKSSPSAHAGKWFSYQQKDHLLGESFNHGTPMRQQASAKFDAIDDTKSKLIAIWKDVLKAREINETSDFFALGGHSLHAARLFNDVERHFDFRPDFDDLLEYPTIAAFSEFLDTKRSNKRFNTKLEEQAALVFFPASSTQKAIWVACQDPKESLAYNEVDVYEWNGKFDVEVFKLATQSVIHAYEILRTTFSLSGDAVQQIISNVAEVDVEVMDASNDSHQEIINQHVHLAADHVFDLSKGPLMYFKIFKKSEHQYFILFNFHHIICDRSSQQIFISSFKHAYAQYEIGNVPTRKPKRSFKELAIDEARRPIRTEDEAFWVRKLAGWHDDTHLAYSTVGDSSNEANSASFDLGAIGKQLDKVCKECGATPFITFFAGVSSLLARYTNRNSTVLGTVVHSRQDVELIDQIGPFINTVLLVSEISGTIRFRDYLQTCRTEVSEAMTHYAYPWERIVSDVRQASMSDSKQLFDVMILFEDMEGEEFEIGKTGRISRVPFEPKYTKCNLILTLRRQANEYSINCVWKKSVYQTDTVSRFAKNLISFLKYAFENVDAPIFKIPMVSDDELLLLDSWNATQYSNSYKGLVERFYERVSQNGERIALTFDGKSMTYSEVWDRAGQIRDVILKHTAPGDNPIIGLITERAFNMITGIWGILRAGFAYLPIDPAQPQLRQKFLIEDSNIKLVIADHDNTSFDNRIWINVNSDLGSNPVFSDAIRNQETLAYVIYTSGSTGIPKGVMIEEAGAVNRIDWMWRHYNFSPEDVFVQKTPYTFDVSVWEIFMPLCFGARLVLCQKEYVYEPSMMVNLIDSERVTTIHFVPSMYNAFLAALSRKDVERLRTLRKVFVSGEALKSSTVSEHYRKLGLPLHNLYGPTEASVDVTYYETTPGELSVPIGMPISNIGIHLLDDELNPLPIGAIGNICISGIGIARGYLNRPELTNETFRFCQYLKSKIYLTGDLGRFRHDGAVEFLGRRDHQVKLRGNRIELGEIENTVMSHKDVTEAVAVVESVTGESSVLCLFYTGNRLAPEDLSNWIRMRLPEYFVPNRYIHLDKLPSTSSGKTDRKLLLPSLFDISKSTAQSVTVQDGRIAAMWKQILGVKEVGGDNNFFLIGGDSIKVVRFLSQLKYELGVEISFSDFLRNATITKLTALVEKRGLPHKVSEVASLDRASDQPISPGQKRLWILNEIEEDHSGYVIFSVYQISGEVNLEALRYAFRSLLLTHDVLRSFYAMINDELRQHLLPIDYFTTELVEDAINGIEDLSHRLLLPFDLSTGPLFRSVLMKASEDSFYLGISMHHIVSDAWSIDILTKDLARFYNDFLSGKIQSATNAHRFQYSDYANSINRRIVNGDFKREEDFWRLQFRNKPHNIRLPYDYDRGTSRTFKGDVARISFDPKVVTQLREFTFSKGTTLFASLLTVVKTFLYKYSGSSDITIGVPVANREDFRAYECVGFFVNTLPIRSHIDSKKSFQEQIDFVTDTFAESLNNCQLPLNEIIEIVNPQRNTSQNPLFDILISMEDESLGELTGMTNLVVRKLDLDLPVAQFDLSFEFVTSNNGSLDLNIRFSTDLFKRETIELMIKSLDYWLHQVIENPATSIARLSCLTVDAKGMLDSFNTHSKHSEYISVVEMFEQQVISQPNSTAVLCNGSGISYRELNEQAKKVAYFINSKGLGTNSTVAILIKPSLDLIAVMLGILKSGAAYLALDFEYPSERIKYCLKTAQASLLISDPLGHNLDVETTTFEKILQTDSKPGRLPSPQPGDVAYLMFTSGSTGTPRGVIVSHASMAKYIRDSRELLNISVTDRVIQQSSVAFDASVEEIFVTLCSGAMLLVLPYGGKDIEGMIELIAAESATVVLPTPLVLNELNKNYDRIPTVRLLASGGDRLLPGHLNNLIGKKRLINVYGPTEATVAVTFQEVLTVDDLTTIGKPFPGDYIYILDKDYNQVPIGVDGEIFIGGKCLAIGYIDNENERFIASPFSNGARLLKTGDIARWTNDGKIVFVGRQDTQTKIRGHRIDLSEIEKVISSLDKVDSVSVGMYDWQGESILVAFVSGVEAQAELALMAQLRSSLPYYMIPNKIIRVSKLPMNSNHKVDQSGLKKILDLSEVGSKKISPRNEVEKMILECWKEVLQTDQFGVTDNFFEVGGNSIKLLKLLRLLREKANSTVSVGQLFSNTTIEAQAWFLAPPTEQLVTKDVVPVQIEF